MTSHTAERPHVTQLGDAAEQCLDDQHLSNDARALLRGLLYVGATIESATDRLTVDLDGVAAAVDGRLQDITAAIDPSFVAPPRVPWRYRLAALLRPASAGWHETAGGER
jgi:hypothetical protein